TEYIASSAALGARPNVATIRWYSSSVRPSSRYGGGAAPAFLVPGTRTAAASVTPPTLPDRPPPLRPCRPHSQPPRPAPSPKPQSHGGDQPVRPGGHRSTCLTSTDPSMA